MNGEQTTPTDTQGTQTPVIPKEVIKPVETSVKTPSSLEEAREINKEKKELLDREEKLQKRREDLHAEQMVSGHTIAGQEIKPKTQEDKDQEIADKLLADSE